MLLCEIEGRVLGGMQFEVLFASLTGGCWGDAV